MEPGSTMTEAELRCHAVCSICKLPIGRLGNISFHVATIEHFIIDVDAMKRQDGLAAFLRSPRLSQVMGPAEVMARSPGQTLLTICEICASGSTMTIPRALREAA
jgi:hypothetical protein